MEKLENPRDTHAGRSDSSDELKLSQQRISLLVQQTPLGVIAWDRDFKVVEWNKSAERIFGYTQEEAIGTHAFMIIPQGSHAQVSDVWTALISQKGGHRSRNENLTKDGRIITCEWYNTPLIDAHGDVIGVASMVEDITERVRVECELHEREQHVDLAIEAAQLGLWYGNFRTGAIVSRGMGPVSIMKPRTLEEFKNLIHPDDWSTIEARVERAIKQNERYRAEFRVKTASGEYRWVAAHGNVVRSPDSSPIGIIGVELDISERKAAEQQLRTAHSQLEARVRERTAEIEQLNESLRKRAEELESLNRELEAFSYSVSHDLRAPLRAIDGFSRILLEGYSECLPADARHYLATITDNTRRMAALIDDLLAFSRLGRQTLKLADVDMMPLVQGVYDELRDQCGGRDIKLDASPLPIARADKNLIRQVWTNLIGNAIKFTRGRSPAEIRINADQRANEIVYSIEDNGAGFDMRYAGKLFGVFQRLHSTEQFEGTGVGLAIVQRIITRHGGRIWAEGEIDKGAKFSFALPSTPA